ncbi:glycosyltransferase family 2 protein [Rufibacter ruber]|uniref:glycosyltransferase family 2 protein n=1 Tax=Rufibacter ruber TaxID=1783499 RepID=UPI0009ED6A1D|nr:glycosyltransferase family 2 protein [Rufibacter ruber]
MTTPLVSIAMATYNGEKFLEEQLASIFNQTHPNLEVVVCDDISTDRTIDILQQYALTHNLKYTVNRERLGVVQNFSNAISMASGDYVALADQDDVWLPTKIENSLQKLLLLERQSSPLTPALVFTDLQVVDEQLQPLYPSYWEFMKLNPSNWYLNRILVENVMTGCTALMNKPLLEIALPIPNQALMHDTWLLLTAASFGKVSFLQERTVLYRQHPQNVVGARQSSLKNKFQSALSKITRNNFSLLGAEIEQAAVFYNRYSSKLNYFPEKKNVLKAFISLQKVNFFRRKFLILKFSFFGSSFKKALNVLARA